jgi:CheY-like chemotaxis protein
MGQPKILIVDDDYKFSDFAKMLLESVSYEATICDDAREVVRAAKVIEPHLILMDISMPEMNGIEVTKLLKSDPQTKAIPVILCSITIHRNDMPDLSTCGAALFLQKPLKRDELKASIDQLIGRH